MPLLIQHLVVLKKLFQHLHQGFQLPLLWHQQCLLRQFLPVQRHQSALLQHQCLLLQHLQLVQTPHQHHLLDLQPQCLSQYMHLLRTHHQDWHQHQLQAFQPQIIIKMCLLQHLCLQQIHHQAQPQHLWQIHQAQKFLKQCLLQHLHPVQTHQHL
jgi:hypothetical protein